MKKIHHQQEKLPLTDDTQYLPDSFDIYRNSWCESILEGNPSTLEKGRRFGQKLFTQWLNIALDSEGLIYCDGSGDGGIDLAFLDRGHNPVELEDNGSDDNIRGDTWYIVQSKYGSAFQGSKTIIDEGHKIIETLCGYSRNSAEITESFLKRISTFFLQASKHDQLVLVFATEDLLSESEQRALEDVRIMGIKRLESVFQGSFHVESISIRTIYRRLSDNGKTIVPMQIKLGPIEKEDDLLVGTVSLPHLYQFLKTYKLLEGDLDLLYEKNVRLYLGHRTEVNKAIYATLEDEPHRFGLYNNGVTIVVADVRINGNEASLVDPHVVNGGQTTRMIWRIGAEKFESGGTGKHGDIEEWQQKFSKGVVIVKIVRVGPETDLLRAIARYTNKQNAVRERDFVALEEKFPEWRAKIKEKYGVFLEIQRGSQDLKRTPGKRIPNANAFDLLKVYGSGWLGVAGIAAGDNAPFAPNGSIYKQIMDQTNGTAQAFDEDDLYVTYRLQVITDKLGFSSKESLPSRRQTRFLFYMVAIQLLDSILRKEDLQLPLPESKDTSLYKAYTKSLLKLFLSEDEVIDEFFNCAAEMIDEYLTQDDEAGIYTEPAFFGKFRSDLSNFLQWNKFGRQDTKDDMPHFHQKLNDFKRYIGTSRRGQVSIRSKILEIIK